MKKAIQGGWTAPGAISVAPIFGPIPTASPANPLGTAATTAPLSLSSNALLPLAYWYGHPETKKNPLLMDRLIRNLGENINDRFELDSEGMFILFDTSLQRNIFFIGRASGLIVDTPSSFASGPATNNHRHSLIKACIEAFKSRICFFVPWSPFLIILAFPSQYDRRCWTREA